MKCLWPGFLLLALCASSAIADVSAKRAQLDLALHETWRYRDDGFRGGLGAEGMALSRKLADALGANLPGESRSCDQPDPMQGRLVRGPRNESDKAARIANLPEPLKGWAELVDSGSAAQHAIAALAIGLVGTKASVVSEFLGADLYGNSPWVTEAIERMECDQRAYSGLQSLRPPPELPAADPQTLCDVRELDWLARHALDGSRRWPPGLVEAVIDEARASCKEHGSLRVAEATVARIGELLDSTSAEPAFQGAWLELLTPGDVSIAQIEDSLRLASQAPNEQLTWQAQRVLVASGLESGARQFARWLEVDDVFHWGWGDTTKLASAHPEIVLPALHAELSNPVWSNRAAAVEVLGETGDARAIPLIVGAIDSLDWPTAQAAANALTSLAPRYDAARAALERLASEYWSGRVRAVAAVGLKHGKTIKDDPFGCGQTAEELLNAKPVRPDELCMSVGYGGANEHLLPVCADGSPGNGTYRLAHGETERVRWQFARRGRLPRIDAAGLSDWCQSVGSTSALEVDDGWLVGCDGFEREGVLGFVARSGKAAVVEIRRMGVTMIVRSSNRIFVAGSAPFEFHDAGALFEVSRSGEGKWITTAVAALPSVPDAYAALGTRIAFRDSQGAVLFDPSGMLTPMECLN